jgi:hypothetical protein
MNNPGNLSLTRVFKVPEYRMRLITPQLIIISIVCMTLSSCSAQRPVLSSNDHLARVGAPAAERDIDECMRRGEVVEREKPKDNVIGNTVTSSVVGAAAGGAGGAVVGRAGEGAGVGAAAAAATSLTLGLLKGLFSSDPPTPTYKDVVNNCLRAKGYDPVGWK